MRVHAKVKVKGLVSDFYFNHPIRVLTEEDCSLREALEIVETSLQAGYYVVPAITYESNQVLPKNERFIIGIFDRFADKETFGTEQGIYQLSPLEFDETREKIEADIEKVRDYIRDGHTYQVNYTTRLHGTFSGDAHTLFLQLMSKNNGDYAFYIEYENEKIISCSPELFFERDGDTIRTKPMKGTSQRYADEVRDEESYQFLKHSTKDRAENVMIVDLLRNDLSKIAQKGTVRCPELFTIEKYETVYQMTSTIEAELKTNASLNDVMQGLFPCGSITGAPKQSTMRIIESLESSPRQYYCGTIGLLLSPDNWVFNVPIRTLYIQGTDAVYGAGAGITYDSNPSDEYDEIVAKTSFLWNGYVQLIESMRVDAGAIPRLDLHIKRLKSSADALGYPFNDNNIALIDQYVKLHLSAGVYKLRALLNQEGTLSFEHSEFNEDNEMFSTIHHEPNDGVKEYINHKTTVRYHYELTGDNALNLYYNKNNELTEFNIGNIVIKESGQYYTPKHSSELLNGVMRQQLIHEQKLTERTYLLNEFIEKYRSGSIEVFMINSVREWTKVKFEI